MAENFPYVYDRGRWVSTERLNDDDGLTVKAVLETVLSMAALAVCLAFIAMLVLCM